MKAKLDTMIAIPLSKLKADVATPFPLYLLLRLNDRLVPIRMSGESLGASKYREFLEKNLAELWVPSDFQKTYLEYLDKIEGKVESLADVINNLEQSPAANPNTKSEEVELVREILEDEVMPPEDKAQILSAIGQDILRALNQISDRGEEPRRQGLKRCKQLADEILELAYQHKSIYDEIVALRNSQDDLEHSMMVGTIAVMFGLAMGIADKNELADMTLAGLFHDIGLVKVNPAILLKPETSWTGPERHEYEAHIHASVNLLKQSSKEFNPGVFRMIQEHHENHDGSGFPEHRQGGAIAASSQVLHLANLFDRLCTGKIDGIEVSPQEAFDRISQIATNRDAVQEVDPELVKKIFDFLLKDAAAISELKNEIEHQTSGAADEAFRPAS